MGKTGILAATTKSLERATSSRPPSRCECHPLVASHGCSLAGYPTRTIWQSSDDFQPVLSVAKSRDLAADMVKLNATSRCSREDRLGSPLCRWYDCPRSPACCWGKGGEPEIQALGRSVGGFSTKVHVKAEGFGKPINFVVTSGERHEAVAFPDLVKGGSVKRQGRGRPKYRSRYLVGDKAYSSQKIRQQLRRSGTTPVIPKRSNEKRLGRFNRGLYRERNSVERLINRLKQYRRIATRYEKYAVNYLAMLMIGAIRLWL